MRRSVRGAEQSEHRRQQISDEWLMPFTGEEEDEPPVHAQEVVVTAASGKVTVEEEGVTKPRKRIRGTIPQPSAPG